MIPRIWDTFLYNGETELAEIRREEFRGHYVVPVRIVGDRTHSGRDQAATGDVVVDLGERNAFDAECHQRGAVDAMAAECPDDLFLHGDVDEIPRLIDVLAEATDYDRPVRLRGDLHQLRLDWWLPDHADAAVHPFAGPILASGRDITDAGGSVVLRRDASLREVVHSGWHLQWVMTPAECVRKIATFSERSYDVSPYNDEEFWRDCAARGVDPLGRWTLQPAPINSLPTAVRKDPERFVHLMREAVAL